ncbi:ABC transporter substrate-binding protein [Salinibacterium sp. SWN1162]|uniref:ABC transporter substrate-binding protein n=1 Tax=Salinibacterium sp. SWN1162 TaxID=2792053 RepID=UPI0018CD2802|nr:extracellular solute-binding protein [Salinibacterium sp. SWN1162]MBH0008392.1 extracellular solute-binding protein [Salinibacterium sp. SWN1162]
MHTQLSRHRWLSGAAVATVATLAMVGLSACSSDSATNGSADELNILLHSNPPTDKALTAMTEAFEEANPDIKVNLDFVQTNDLPSTRSARLAAGKVDITEGSTGIAAQPLPDYVTGTPESDWIKGVDAGNWVDLGDQEFLANYLPEVVDALSVDGKTYQVPTSLNYYTGVYYNKELFAKAGVTSAPTTWTEFVAAMKALDKNNIIPFSIGGKDNWPVGLIPKAAMQSAFPTVDDRVNLEKALWDGSAAWNDPALVTVMDQTETVYEYADPSFAGVDYATAQGQFAGGQTAMTIDGTWAATLFTETNPNLDYGFFPFPGSENAADNQTLGGKIDFTFAVPTSSKNQDAALRWIAYFSEPSNYATFAVDGGVIPAQPGVELSAALDPIKPYLETFQLGWEDIFHTSSGSPKTLNYADIAPMGKIDSASEAQDRAQQEWLAATTGN